MLRSGNHDETEQSIILLLNHERISEGTKLALIGSQSGIIKNIIDISTEPMQKALIAANKIAVNWENLLVYFSGQESKALDQTVIEFLKQPRVYELLANQQIKAIKSHDLTAINDFFIQILRCNELPFTAYTSLLNSYRATWYNLHFEELDKDKVKYLIDNHFLSFRVNEYNKLKEHFGADDYHVIFIEDNQSEFLKIIAEIVIEKNELTLLLQSSKLNIGAKTKIIEYIKDIDESLIIDNATIGRLVCQMLSRTPYMPISLALLESLINNSNLLEDRVRLLNSQASQCDDSDLVGLVSKLGADYRSIFKKQHKPTFLITDYHQKLFEILQERELIKKYDKDKKNENKYRVTANY